MIRLVNSEQEITLIGREIYYVKDVLTVNIGITGTINACALIAKFSFNI